jgi:FecR protein
MATGLSYRMLAMFALSTFGVTAGVAQSGSVGGSGVATGGQEAMASAPIDNGAEPGDTHVRIVRLSDVKGSLSLDRKTGLGFEQTMPNMPIVQGEKLRTQDGFAEVEFEDNTTLRLAPESQVDFELLALRSSGAKASLMEVKHGIVYVSTESTKGNEFLLRAGETKITVAPSTHLRMEVNETRTVLSVFNGSVEVAHNGETKTVGKKETLMLAADQMTMASKVEKAPYDGWDKESNDYHAVYSRANAFAGGGNAFGLSDLNYYGNFVNTGCGQMWQPYLTSASWSPYQNGLWAYYPNAGYSWVSPYPWGWLPYHSGSWGFCQGAGWGWQPGGSWYGLNNITLNNGFANNGTAIGGGGAGFAVAGSGAKGVLHSPLRPVAPAAVAGSRPSMALANQSPMVMSGEEKPGNFVFQKNSAGLGVPRGSLGDLKGVSNDVQKHGFASMPVYATASGGGGIDAHGASRGGPVTLRQATPNVGSTNSSTSPAFQQGNNMGNSGATSSSPAAPSTASRGGGGMSSGGGGMSSGGSGGGGAHGGGAQGSPK